MVDLYVELIVISGTIELFQVCVCGQVQHVWVTKSSICG